MLGAAISHWGKDDDAATRALLHTNYHTRRDFKSPGCGTGGSLVLLSGGHQGGKDRCRAMEGTTFATGGRQAFWSSPLPSYPWTPQGETVSCWCVPASKNNYMILLIYVQFTCITSTSNHTGCYIASKHCTPNFIDIN